MSAVDFTEIAPSHKGMLRDEFEQFAGEFLIKEGFEIVKGVDRGPDQGRDLIVSETRSGPGGSSVVKWLVSAKHKAHSGASVVQTEESDLRDRIENHGCQGFIPFYSTVPSAGVSSKIDALKIAGYGVRIYDPATIDRHLTENAAFQTLFARYFPLSFKAWIQTSQHIQTLPKPDRLHGENRFFLRPPHLTISDGLEEAKERNLPLFVVIYDPDHPTHSKIDFALGYFMEYHTVKRLVDAHFVPVITTTLDEIAKSLVPADDPLEVALWVILGGNGSLIQRQSVYANPDVGLGLVRNAIAAQ